MVFIIEVIRALEVLSMSNGKRDFKTGGVL
jgi:hypothetical protein